MHRFTIGEALSVGWEKTKKHFWFLAVVFIGVWLVSMIPSFIIGDTQNADARGSSGGLLGFLIGIFIQIGVIRLTLKILDDVHGTWRDFIPDWETFWNMLLGTILYVLMCIAGFILLIVPGIIWAIKYRFYSYLIVDKRMKALDALKESGRITQGEKMHLFQFALLSILITIAGALVILVGLLAAIPVIAISFAWIYRRLSGAAHHAEHVSGPTTAVTS